MCTHVHRHTYMVHSTDTLIFLSLKNPTKNYKKAMKKKRCTPQRCRKLKRDKSSTRLKAGKERYILSEFLKSSGTGEGKTAKIRRTEELIEKCLDPYMLILTL